MPQFDSLSFLSQIVWSFGTFGFLYLSVVRVIVPGLAIVLKARKKFIRFEPSLLTEHNADVIFKGVLAANAEPLVVRSVKLGLSRIERLSVFQAFESHGVSCASVSIRLFSTVALRGMQASKSLGFVVWLAYSSRT